MMADRQVGFGKFVLLVLALLLAVLLALIFVWDAKAAHAQTQMGPIRTPQLNQGLYVGQSGYPSIQSAVTYACRTGQQSFAVIIHPGMNPPDTPAQVTGGCNGTYIEDMRSVPTYYTWNGTHYVQTSNGGGGGGGGGVVVTTNLLSGDGGGATVDSGVQGNLGYLQGKVLYSTGYAGTPPFAVPATGRAGWWWIPPATGQTTQGPNGSAAMFGVGGGATNAGVQLWGANANGTNDQIYLDCQVPGCTFNLPLSGQSFFSNGFSTTTPPVPASGRANYSWLAPATGQTVQGPNGSAEIFGVGGASANAGVQLWGANSTGSNDQLYLDCQIVGCDFKVTPTFNGSPLAAPAPPLNSYQVMGANNTFATKSLSYVPATGSVNAYNSTTDPFYMFSYNGTGTYSPQNFFHDRVHCSQDQLQLTGNEEHDCLYINNVSFGPGLAAGNGGNGNNGWTVNKTFYVNQNAHTMGIDQAFSVWSTPNHTSDSALFYGYLWNKGGYSAFSDEGATAIKANGGNTGEYFSGYSGNSGTGLTRIGLYNYGDEAQTGAFLINTTTPLVSGHVTGFSNGVMTTAETHTVTPHQGTTTSAIVLPNGHNQIPGGVSITVAVTVSLGTFDTNSTIMFACPEYWDQVTPTTVTAPSGGVQNITANFIYGHQAGCQVYQGGPFGAFDFVADRSHAPNAQTTQTSYLVAGAPTATTLDVRMYQAGGVQNIPPFRHNYGQSVGGATLTRTTGTVQVCGLPYTYSGQAIQITATDTTYNGTFTATTQDNNGCQTWANAGTNGSTTGTAATGGTVDAGGLTGTGAFYVWPEALILAAESTRQNVNGGVQSVFNGIVDLAPNDMTVASGNFMINPNYMSNKTQMLGAEGAIYSPPTASTNVWSTIAYNGPGATTANFMGQSIVNFWGWPNYLGGGGSGLLQGPIAQRIQGPHYQTKLTDSPLGGGVVEEVLPSPMCTNGQTSQCGYRVRQLDLHNGNAGFVESYDPLAMSFSTYMWDDHGGHSQSFINSGAKNDQFYSIDELIQNTGYFAVTNGVNKFTVPWNVLGGGNANVPSPAIYNNAYLCTTTNKACDGTSTVESSFDEGSGSAALDGTAPRICINGCTGTWGARPGVGDNSFTYTSGTAQSSTPFAANSELVDTGNSDGVLLVNVKTCANSTGAAYCVIFFRYTDANNNDQLACVNDNPSYTQCYMIDTVGGTSTNLGNNMAGGITGNYMIVMKGTQITIFTPTGNTVQNTTNTGTKAGFFGAGPGFVQMQVASFIYRNFTTASTGGGGSMVYPPAGVAVSTGTAWTTPIAPSSIALLTGAAFTGAISAPSGSINGSPICTTATGCGGGGGMSGFNTNIIPKGASTTTVTNSALSDDGTKVSSSEPFSVGGTTSVVTYTTVYTVTTLPSASTVGAGATALVSDATSFTPGTCTGGGTSYMIAVSNGSSWSCH